MEDGDVGERCVHIKNPMIVQKVSNQTEDKRVVSRKETAAKYMEIK